MQKLPPEIKTTIETLNPWWQEKKINTGIKRLSYLKQITTSINNNLILFILGSRRVGKTYLILQTIETLITSKKTKAKEILFLSLDNTNLKKLNLINYISQSKFKYIFLDEIQYLNNWQQTLKSLYDIPDRKFKITCSGSASFLIQDQKAFTTGRSQTITIYPLNFNEFQTFSKTNNYRTDINDYLEYGGYPEYVLNRQPNYHTNLLEDTINKDIVAKYNIRLLQPIKELLNLIAKQIGYKTSLNKMAHTLKITDDTVKQYLEHLSKTYILTSIYKYSPSINDRIYSEKKYYFWDTGLRNTLTGFEDIGSLAENATLIKLKQLYAQAEIYYYSNTAHQEIDFIVLEKNVAYLFESKHDKYFEKIENKIPNVFLKQIKGLNIKKRTIITDGLSREIKIKNQKVQLLSLEDFLNQ